VKWLILFIVTVVGFALIGYGFYPLAASEATTQSDFVGWMMILAGLPCLIYVAVNIKPRQSKSEPQKEP